MGPVVLQSAHEHIKLAIRNGRMRCDANGPMPGPRIRYRFEKCGFRISPAEMMADAALCIPGRSAFQVYSISRAADL